MGRGRDALSMGSSVGALAARRVITAASAATGEGKMVMSTKRSRRSQGNYGVDVRQFRRRFVALELMYIGWAYHGFAAQFVAEKKKKKKNEQDTGGDSDAAEKSDAAILLREEEHPTVEVRQYTYLQKKKNKRARKDEALFNASILQSLNRIGRMRTCVSLRALTRICAHIRCHSE